MESHLYDHLFPPISSSKGREEVNITKKAQIRLNDEIVFLDGSNVILKHTYVRLNSEGDFSVTITNDYAHTIRIEEIRIHRGGLVYYVDADPRIPLPLDLNVGCTLTVTFTAINSTWSYTNA